MDKPQAKVIGVNKQDDGDKFAKLVVRVNHLYKERDHVETQIPTSRESPIMVVINGEEKFSETLPEEVVCAESKSEVKYGQRGEIIFKLKKAYKEMWVPRKWGSSGERD